MYDANHIFGFCSELLLYFAFSVVTIRLHGCCSPVLNTWIKGMPMHSARYQPAVSQQRVIRNKYLMPTYID